MASRIDGIFVARVRLVRLTYYKQVTQVSMEGQRGRKLEHVKLQERGQQGARLTIRSARRGCRG